MKINIIVLTVILVVVAVGSFLFLRQAEPRGTPTAEKITDFTSCVAAGNLVMESYPRRCRSTDGRTFTEDIGNEMNKIELIRCDFPRPNAVVRSPLLIEGEARGYWFFEADFPVRLLDADGNELATGTAYAQDEWMTEEFVPFVAELEFAQPTTDTGDLRLLRDNPSGFPENDDVLTIPVKFQ